jgi:hypothetical protein
MGARKKLGRPSEIPNRVKLFVYLTAGERQAIARAAKRANVSTSAWVRAVALTALHSRTGRTP